MQVNLNKIKSAKEDIEKMIAVIKLIESEQRECDEKLVKIG